MQTSLAVRFVVTVMMLLAAATVQPAWAQSTQAGELADIHAQFLRTQDAEQAIALGNAALAAAAATSDWKLPTSREAFLADVHSGLGRAYVNRTQGVRADNIEAAIKHFEAALAVAPATPGTEASAAIHSNLAVAYWSRIRGERIDSEDRALSHFETALATFTREAHPLQWAQINSNMAALFITRHRGDRDSNVETSISYLEQALGVFAQDSQPQFWAMAHNNLGNAYRVRKAGAVTQNLDTARGHLDQALKVFTRNSVPSRWAQIQVAMATILQRRNGPADEEAAITRLQAALEVFTPDAFPEQWAKTQYALGNALAGHSSDTAAYRQKAMAAYRSALTISTLQNAPFDHLQISRRLANAMMQSSDCASAAPVHTSARQAFLLLFGQGLNKTETADLVAEAFPCSPMPPTAPLNAATSMRPCSSPMKAVPGCWPSPSSCKPCP